jgi:outer membrane biosynthesis protein TonB
MSVLLSSPATVTCPSCGSSFPVDPGRVPEGGILAICSGCHRAFPVTRPAGGAADPVAVDGQAEAGEDGLAGPGALLTASTPGFPELVTEGDASPEAWPPSAEPVEGAGEEAEVEGGLDAGLDLALEAEAEPETSVEARVEPEPGIEVHPESEPEPEPESPVEPEVESPVEPVAEVESPVEPVAEMVMEIEPDLEPQLRPDVDSPVEPDTSVGSWPGVTRGPDSYAESSPPLVTPPPSPPPAPSFPASAAPPSEEPETPASARARFGLRDPANRAKRLARVLASDMITYNPARYADARRQGTLREDFRDEIEKSWEEYVDQVGEVLATTTPHFADALNEVLAQGEHLFHGPGFPY